MTNLRCNRRPQSAGGVTQGNTYENATLYRQDMSITENFEEAHYVTIINDNGRVGTRYRASLFEVVPTTTTERLDSSNFTYEVEYFNGSVRITNRVENDSELNLGIKVFAVLGRRRILVFDSTGRPIQVQRTSNSFSCGVALLVNIQRAFEIGYFNDTTIMEKLNAYEQSTSTATRTIEIIEVDTDDIQEAIQSAIIESFPNFLRENIPGAFAMMSVRTDSSAFRWVRSMWNSTSDTVVNSNSNNEIVVGIININ